MIEQILYLETAPGRDPKAFVVMQGRRIEVLGAGHAFKKFLLVGVQ